MIKCATTILIATAVIYFTYVRGNPAIDPLVTTTTVNELLANATAFDGRRVNVKGTVVSSAALMGAGAYRLEDGTAEVLVFSGHGIPKIGTEQSVSGVFKQAFALNGLQYAVILQK